MTSMHSVIPEEKLTEAYRLLLEMRDNCVKHADDQYDDTKRKAKYEALNIAMAAMGRSIPPRWISVGERMPISEEYVLCWYAAENGKKWHTVGKLQDQNGTWELDVYLDDPDSDFTVTHWMLLPEPPKEE